MDKLSTSFRATYKVRGRGEANRHRVERKERKRRNDSSLWEQVKRGIGREEGRNVKGSGWKREGAENNC